MPRAFVKSLAYTVVAAALVLLARASEVPLKALAGQFMLRHVWDQTAASLNKEVSMSLLLAVQRNTKSRSLETGPFRSIL